jgi:hypothetical protein
VLKRFLCVVLLLLAAAPGTAADRVTLATNWKAEAEHGGDPRPAHALIKKDNPEMTDDLLAYGRETMKRHGVVDSGDALKLGIGAMTDARWKAFAADMIRAGLYPPNLDLSQAYTLQFVNRKVGMQTGAPSRP